MSNKKAEPQRGGFKLLAVIPLEGCNARIRKNLKTGTVYQFYSNYTIEISPDKKEVVTLKKNFEDNLSLFKINEKLHLNVHSIVGENGSGKSSIFELFYYFIYLLGSTIKVNNNQQPMLPIIDKDLLFKHNLIKKQTESFFELTKRPINLNRKGKKIVSQHIIDEAIKISKDHEIEIEALSLLGRNFNPGYFYFQLMSMESAYQREIDKQRFSFQKIEEQVACTLLYEIDGNLLEGRYINKEFSFFQFKQDGTKEKIPNIKLEDFFYTISLNYSHHSLNSLSIGRWINKLFHKNDAYITPLVINPMRNEGNFDINDELHLSKERILMNIISSLLSNDDFKILDKYKVSKVIYRLKENLFPISNFELTNLHDQYDDLINHTIKFTNPNEEKPLKELALGYLQKKIIKLKNQYAPLFLGDTANLKTEDFNIELNRITKTLLLNDASHITKKINQTVNFIEHFDPSIWKLDSPKENQPKSTEITLSINQLKNWVQKCNPEYASLDSFQLSIIAHPGIFYVDFVLQDELGEELSFKDLSSGEQQLIFNTNTIIYHVNNLNSAHKSTAKEELPRPRYTNLNVVLDEIELYYHPEYQRKFISTLIKELDTFSKNSDLTNCIRSMNICFLTHSPFILSDIPKSNVLRLKKGKPSDKEFKETFGANIHDLLANDFFLQKGFMGEFAKEKINEVIRFLNHAEATENIKKIKLQLKQIDSFVGNSHEKETCLQQLKYWNSRKAKLKDQEKRMTPNECFCTIELIGEPIIKSTLLRQHHNLFGNQNDSDIDEVETLKILATKYSYDLIKK